MVLTFLCILETKSISAQWDVDDLNIQVLSVSIVWLVRCVIS